jgi:hypothetical protein
MKTTLMVRRTPLTTQLSEVKTHTFRKRVRKVKIREAKKGDKSDVK